MSVKKICYCLMLLGALPGCEKEEAPEGILALLQVLVSSTAIELSGAVSDGLPVDRSIVLVFSLPLNRSAASQAITLRDETQIIDIDLNFSSEDKMVVIYPAGPLKHNTTYTLEVSAQLKGARGESFASREIRFKTVVGVLEITAVTIGDQSVDDAGRLTGIPADLNMTFDFSAPVDEVSFKEAAHLSGADVPSLALSSAEGGTRLTVTPTTPLAYLSRYEFTLSDALTGAEGEPFSGYTTTFYTVLDSTYKFPEISDEALLTKVQEQTFKYFWNFAHPISGLARERNTSGETVTIGGSGFGVMTILVGIERGFITRQEGVDRLETIIEFLKNADRFHGAWSHWMNGSTGEVIPFSSDDDGGDLVETAFMIQGLLTVRQYLDENDAQEATIIEEINQLWEAVEWNWYTQGGQNVLYWHWSPNFGWQKNHKIQGWNEALIVYVLAASSPTHPVDAAVYHEGLARNGNMVNGNTYYGIPLPLGIDRGGPLFFAHYSFLGLDPRNLEDQYANYWEQNVNHSLINRQYCILNPLNHVGYGENCWGLTASDGNEGYSAHAPNNDRGVITPTAALSSMPYTPEASMAALHHFYYLLGDKLWGEYGFYDAFNITANWYADSYIAIDQGPIILMIENHRSALLWDLFMSCPEIQQGLDKLGF